MIADRIIDKVARDSLIKPAVEELVSHVLGSTEGPVTSATCTHTFDCTVNGQSVEVTISLQVAGKKKH